MVVLVGIVIAVLILNLLFLWFMDRAAKFRRAVETENQNGKSVFHAEFFSTRLSVWCGWFRHAGVVKQGYVVNLEQHALNKGSCCDVNIGEFDSEIGKWKLEAIFAEDD